MASISLDFSLVAEAEVPAGLSPKGLESLARFVLASEGASGVWVVTLALVDDDRLRALHRDFMGSDTPTDIMTFPRDDSLRAARHGGDLVISVDHAITQSVAWGKTPAGEIEFLVAHGLLHLLGWRDDADGDRGRMLARQEELIEQWRSGAEIDEG